MLKKFWLVLIFSGINFLLWFNLAQAGFGISPPYVKSDKITPGTLYEQKINLLRSSAEEELTAEISVNAPEISSWITIDKGNEFTLPKGELQVPMIVRVDVPKNAEIAKYAGFINIRITPKGGGQGAVAIALGARVDIDLNVTNETFPDFLVREVSIPELEILKRPWNWPVFSWFFYRIKVVMRIENTGNVKIAPSKVHLEIWDLNEKVLLESRDDKTIDEVLPFQTNSVEATFPTKLKQGQYWGKVKIYKDAEVVRSDKIVVTILPPGSLPGGNKLGVWPWLMLSGIIALILLFFLLLVKVRIWRFIYKIFYIFIWPARFIGEKLKKLLAILKVKFWRWLHKKSSQYQNQNNDHKLKK